MTATERAEAAFADLVEENQMLRRLLWFRHGCPTHVLYGDDGEMQCNVCFIDFKRMSAPAIARRWETVAERAIREHAARLKAGG